MQDFVGGQSARRDFGNLFIFCKPRDILEVLTGRILRLEANEETPVDLPSKDQQALRKDYDLLGFAINTAGEFKKAINKTKGACAEFFRRLWITYNHC